MRFTNYFKEKFKKLLRYTSHVIRYKNGGFTFVEILIVMSIVVIMSAVIFADYGKQGQRFVLQRSIHKLAQDIRRVGEMGMSAQKFNGGVPAGGYGLYFNGSTPDYYILFADNNSDYVYSPAEKVGEEIYLEEGVEISSLSSSPLYITFRPPDPVVTITDGVTTTSEATIVINLKSDPASAKTIKVNQVGLIDID